MNTASPAAQTNLIKPLRVWPAVLFVLAGVVLRLLSSLVENGPSWLWMASAFGPALCGISVLLWWLIASRATWKERLFGLLGIAAIIAVTLFAIHPTMLGPDSYVGPGVLILVIPLGMAGFAIGAFLCAKSQPFKRTVVALLLAACGFGSTTLVRTEGMWGNFKLTLFSRWSESDEDKLLVEKANAKSDAPITSPIDATFMTAEWPGFRGPDRDGRQSGLKFASDWAANPPKQLWKINVGPAWSSFAVAGDYLFTQEQRGDNEVVICYDATDGSEVWTHEFAGRFDDPLGGPGPRATPTIADGGLFVMGAFGTIARLDPRTGEQVWAKDMQDICGREKPPMWGYSSSPLVVGYVVIVHAGGKDDKGILALDIETGETKWSAAVGEMSYSSPHLASVDDEEFVLMLSDSGMDMFDAVSGENRLAYKWDHSGYRSLQPQVVDGDKVIIPTGMGTGTRMVQLEVTDKTLKAKELWTSLALKPDFNDFVVFEGHAYGFDNMIFTCIDLATGKRAWKGGRYGKGQAMLLQDSGLVLVVSEKGEVVLLKADPSKHTEVAKIPVLDGKTWNHPVIVGNKLFLRNGKEAACFELPVQDTSSKSPADDEQAAVDVELR